MSCYEECNEFLKSKSQKDLGDISQQGSCSYCLYWNGNGPGAEGDSKKNGVGGKGIGNWSKVLKKIIGLN